MACWVSGYHGKHTCTCVYPNSLSLSLSAGNPDQKVYAYLVFSSLTLSLSLFSIYATTHSSGEVQTPDQPLTLIQRSEPKEPTALVKETQDGWGHSRGPSP